MFVLVLFFLYAVSAQTVYSRTYLRGLKKLEAERIQNMYITGGLAQIEDAVFKAAKQGLTHFTTEPFEGCQAYDSDDEPFRLDKDVCENIVNGIYTLVSERFPDSEIIYDAYTKRYTLKWD